MTRFQKLSGVALGALLVASPALADLTARQIWQDWKTFGESFGQQVTGTESMDGDVLTVSDVRMTMTLDDSTVTGTLDQLTFTERGDGTVAIGLPESYPVTVEMTPKAGEAVSMTMMARQTGAQIIASGTPEDTNYDFAADMIGMSIADFQAEDTDIDMQIDVSLADVVGQYQMVAGEIGKLTGDMTAASAASTMKMAEGSSGNGTDWSTMAHDVKLTFDYDLPKTLDATDLSAMMSSGLKALTRYEVGPAQYEMTVIEGGSTMQFKGGSESGLLDVEMGESLRYTGSQTGMTMAVSGSNIPFPEVTTAADQMGFELLMPIGKSEEPEDFGLVTTVQGLSASEQIWSMFDPAGALPRDPANLTIDLSGKAKWLVDVFDPEAAARMGEAKPGELHALTVNDLLLSLMGAELTGSGDFTFDNSGTTDAMPKPEGTMNLKLVGAQTLMGKLTQLGLLQPEQAMGAQMMLGMVARPGDAPDTLVSEISVTKDGTVSANGLPLPF
ncbi:DUF2125 domain-containing protein [Actibacterium ureilyticum]|uniref:DUF2125 domain-containing protein n=1 Tax=Actibacterium ureilyticum TaxID=1590614 RepID=UPI000BAA98BB|nr:DUF2125 domain-containing protein [Actibacterium ureilyticum]